MSSAYNPHYDRPALLELFGRVDGLRVLDAGCGSGLYAQELVARGASETRRRLFHRRAGVRKWNEGWEVSFGRAPLEAIFADFSAAGFTVDTLVEPGPAPLMECEYPEVYRKLQEEAAFIAFRLTKRPDSIVR